MQNKILFIQLLLVNSYLPIFDQGGKNFLKTYLGPYQISAAEVFLEKRLVVENR